MINRGTALTRIQTHLLDALAASRYSNTTTTPSLLVQDTVFDIEPDELGRNSLVKVSVVGYHSNTEIVTDSRRWIEYYFTRVPLSSVIPEDLVLTVPVGVSNTHELLTYLNEQIGEVLVKRDIVLNGVESGTIEIKAGPNSLGYVGSATIELVLEGNGVVINNTDINESRTIRDVWVETWDPHLFWNRNYTSKYHYLHTLTEGKILDTETEIDEFYKHTYDVYMYYQLSAVIAKIKNPNQYVVEVLYNGPTEGYPETNTTFEYVVVVDHYSPFDTLLKGKYYYHYSRPINPATVSGTYDEE